MANIAESSWIHLDPEIRTYVLIPIFVVVVLTSVLRTNITKLTGGSKPATKTPELSELKYLIMFQRIAAFKRNRNFIPSFAAKKLLYVNSNEKKGALGLLQREAPAQLSAMEKMMQQNQDPSTAMNMIKGQFMFLGLHGTLGYWVSHLFSGFLVAKTPFPLTFKIKAMLQRGVDVAALDTSYVSSLSWYFFIMISSSGLIQLFNYLTSDSNLGEAGTGQSSAELMMMASGGAMMGANPMGGPSVDIKKQMEAERDALQVLTHEFALEHAEINLLEKWSKS